MIKENRDFGISFVVRCHNEESTLSDCITSLSTLKVPYEIILVLHNCTDSSKEIAENLKNNGHPIKLYEYNLEISKAGFDTLITPINHPRSLMSYYNYCFSHVNYQWIFKWDADFKATGGLINFLNKLPQNHPESVAFRIHCKLGDHTTSEYYLNNCLVNFGKHIFWEVPLYNKKIKEFTTDSNVLIESIDKNIIKNYWSNTPWYLKENTKDEILSNRRESLLKFLEIDGEPIGFARCCNYDMAQIYYKIENNQEFLSKLGIKLWE